MPCVASLRYPSVVCTSRCVPPFAPGVVTAMLQAVTGCRLVLVRRTWPGAPGATSLTASGISAASAAEMSAIHKIGFRLMRDEGASGAPAPERRTIAA